MNDAPKHPGHRGPLPIPPFIFAAGFTVGILMGIALVISITKAQSMAGTITPSCAPLFSKGLDQ